MAEYLVMAGDLEMAEYSSFIDYLTFCYFSVEFASFSHLFIWGRFMN